MLQRRICIIYSYCVHSQKQTRKMSYSGRVGGGEGATNLKWMCVCVCVLQLWKFVHYLQLHLEIQCIIITYIKYV